jgi:serine/threonine-protein kinase
MGVVYKARDPKIDRFVAVKTIALSGQNPEEEREYRDRFFHEAQAAGRLLHPGIVTIFDTREDPASRIAYIVMEYIAGQSLDWLLSGKNKKLPLDTALRLTEELAEALDHAHAQGVVHRDMKPANILMTREGHAKVTDFGIAKINLMHVTLPGRALGTPAYMSPEQLEGEPVDNRSDLFSLGSILYRMVTGYGPFQGNSATTVCFKVANRDPLRATSLDSDLPPELDAVIARAMAKDPAQRYQRGLEFALDLRELREQGQASNLVSVGFLEKPAQAARKFPSLVPSQVLFWWRMPVVRRGLGFAVAAIILSFLVYHQVRPSRRSPARTAVAVGASAEPVPEASTAQAVAHSGGNVSDSRGLAKAVADSRLDIHIEHRFSAADLSLWIDDKLAYEHSLRGQTKKHWNPFRVDVQETETVRLAAGKHSLRVRVRSKPEKYEQSATISGSFAKSHPTTLQINFERQGKAMRLALR